MNALVIVTLAVVILSECALLVGLVFALMAIIGMRGEINQRDADEEKQQRSPRWQ